MAPNVCYSIREKLTSPICGSLDQISFKKHYASIVTAYTKRHDSKSRTRKSSVTDDEVLEHFVKSLISSTVPCILIDDITLQEELLQVNRLWFPVSLLMCKRFRSFPERQHA